jgi:hypothetical protein
MLHKIIGKVDHADVVTVDEGGELEGAVELLEELAKLGSLGHSFGHIVVLGLSTGVGDDRLPIWA